MVSFVRRPVSALQSALAQSAAQRRLVLVGMASALLLSGCMLSPLFQAPAAVMTGFAVLLGLAACSGGGGGGGGGGNDQPPTEQPPPTVTWPAVVSMDLLNGHPTLGVVLAGEPFVTHANNERAGASLAIGPSLRGDTFGSLAIGAPQATTDVNDGPYTNAGRAYVVFGASGGLAANWDGSAPFALTGVTNGSTGTGFRVEGAQYNHHAGASVAIAGDMNGGQPARVGGGLSQRREGQGLGTVRQVLPRGYHALCRHHLVRPARAERHQHGRIPGRQQLLHQWIHHGRVLRSLHR